VNGAFLIAGLSLVLAGAALANFTTLRRLRLLRAEGLPTWRVQSSVRAQIDDWRRAQVLKRTPGWRRAGETFWIGLALMLPGLALLGFNLWRTFMQT